jgi:hypothetical protein
MPLVLSSVPVPLLESGSDPPTRTGTFRTTTSPILSRSMCIVHCGTLVSSAGTMLRPTATDVSTGRSSRSTVAWETDVFGAPVPSTARPEAACPLFFALFGVSRTEPGLCQAPAATVETG